MKTLKEVKIGETCKVVRLHGEGCRKAPHHGHGHHEGRGRFRPQGSARRPVEVTVRGYELSLRKADAEMIEVE